MLEEQATFCVRAHGPLAIRIVVCTSASKILVAIPVTWTAA
jgi:hypothetical protein